MKKFYLKKNFRYKTREFWNEKMTILLPLMDLINEKDDCQPHHKEDKRLHVHPDGRAHFCPWSALANKQTPKP